MGKSNEQISSNKNESTASKEKRSEESYENTHLARVLDELLGPSLCIVSLVTITAITVDRFLALHHMRYAILVTEFRTKCTLLIIWSISFILSGFGTCT